MALPTKVRLDIVTPDKSIVGEDVDEVVVPGSEGCLGILPGHTALLATLGVGDLWYRIGQERYFLAIAGGFVQVLPDGVTILANIAERAEDIDVPRAELAKKRAEERLTRPGPDIDFERARVAMMKSLIRLQVAARARTRA